jgi:hypothetical protein
MRINREISTLLFCACAATSGAHAAGVLGTPVDGSTVSGVSVISGYHCTSTDIEVFIDGNSIGKAGAGTTLPSTAGVCGHAETGYSLLYNYNNLTPGPHTVAAYADGQLIASHAINTLRSGGTAWLSGASQTLTVPNFPQAGKTATVEWVQSVQNFMVTSIGDNAAIDTSSLGGSYNQSYMDKFSGTCSTTKLTSTTFTVTTAGPDVSIAATFDGQPCIYNLVANAGDAVGGFDLTGYQSCDGGGSQSVSSTATNLRIVGGKLSGAIVDDWGNGCTETLTFM